MNNANSYNSKYLVVVGCTTVLSHYMTVHSIIVIPMSWLKLAFKLRIN